MLVSVWIVSVRLIMCSRSGVWLSDARRDVPTSSQAPAAAVTSSPHTPQSLDANHNTDGNPGNKWTAAVSNTDDVGQSHSASPAVSELIDKGVVYLRDRIFNRDSGKNLDKTKSDSVIVSTGHTDKWVISRLLSVWIRTAVRLY